MKWVSMAVVSVPLISLNPVVAIHAQCSLSKQFSQLKAHDEQLERLGAELINFDAPDRKFVAVSAAHPDRPPIAQAADSKWLDWAPALQRHGIQVEFLCLVDIQRFHDKKFGV